MTVHAIGDKGNRIILDVYEKLLEKHELTGTIDYSPDHHQRMTDAHLQEHIAPERPHELRQVRQVQMHLRRRGRMLERQPILLDRFAKTSQLTQQIAARQAGFRGGTAGSGAQVAVRGRVDLKPAEPVELLRERRHRWQARRCVAPWVQREDQHARLRARGAHDPLSRGGEEALIFVMADGASGHAELLCQLADSVRGFHCALQ